MLITSSPCQNFEWVQRTTTIDSLPIELIGKIIFLVSSADIFHLERTSSTFAKLLDNQMIWTRLFSRDFQSYTQNVKYSIKTFYKINCVVERNWVTGKFKFSTIERKGWCSTAPIILDAKQIIVGNTNNFTFELFNKKSYQLEAILGEPCGSYDGLVKFHLDGNNIIAYDSYGLGGIVKILDREAIKVHKDYNCNRLHLMSGGKFYSVSNRNNEHGIIVFQNNVRTQLLESSDPISTEIHQNSFGIIAGTKSTIRIWDKDDGALLRSIKTDARVWGIACDDEYVAGLCEGGLQIWNLKTGLLCYELPQANRCKFHQDTLVYMHDSYRIHIVNRHTGKPIFSFPNSTCATTEEIREFIINNKQIITLSFSNEINIWNIASGHLIVSFKGSDIACDNEQLVSYFENKILIWDFSPTSMPATP